MGGLGSGGGRNAPKTTDLYRLDLVDLKRLGLLNKGSGGNVIWSQDGEEIGRVHVQREFSGLILNYRHRDWRSGECEAMNELIYLTDSQQHLGGFRYWFVCPGCQKRRRVLFGGRRFRCRECYGVTYPSQYEGPGDRLITRAQKVRIKLGGTGGMDEPFPLKPKWMRWKTYRALERKDEYASAMFYAMWRRWAMMLGEDF